MQTGDELIFSRIARFALADPQRFALRTPEDALTFGDLDRRSTAIAAALLQVGITIGERIGFVCSPSSLAALGHVGILKTGAICVPLNPSHPRDRLSGILEDCEASLLVYEATEAELAQSLSKASLPCLSLASLLLGEAADWRRPSISADSPAVLMYSSGSTGRPKGIIHTHRSTLHLGRAAVESCLHANDRALVCGNTMAFNRTILQGICSSPWRLLILSLHDLGPWLSDYRPTLLLSTPSSFRLIVQNHAEEISASSLRRVVLTGEALYRRDADLFRSVIPSDCLLINELGSNETKTYVQFEVAPTTLITEVIVPVGKPLPGKTVRVLKEDGEECGIGETGEIVVSMNDLPLGYWRQPELTHAAFSDVAESSGHRTYRTGDRGRWLGDDLLLHCGRRDWQCKVRGQKVELMEVEAALCSLGAIDEAAVIHHDTESGVQLIAYYTCRSDVGGDASELRAQLARILPSFMLPGRWVRMEHLPRTASGKIARLQLPPLTSPVPQVDPGDADQPGQMSRPGLERQLSAIWSNVLGHTDFDSSAHFFMVGGHSLSAAQLATSISQFLGQPMPVAIIFRCPSIREQAAWLLSQPRAVDPSPRRLDRSPWSEPPANLVTLQPLGWRPPLFVVHGWGGKLDPYIALARALAPGRPVLGLQASEPWEGRPDPPSVQRMASAYAEQILSAQPNGPIHLLGLSAGGWYAHAVAAELLSRHAPLGLFAVLDARLSARIHRRLGAVLLAQRLLLRLTSAWKRRRESPPGETFGDWLALLRVVHLELYRHLHIRVPGSGRRLPADPFVELLKREYRPPRLPLSVDVFTPADKLSQLERLWRFYARGGVRLHPIFRQHQDFTRPELMPELAAALERALAEAETRS